MYIFSARLSESRRRLCENFETRENGFLYQVFLCDRYFLKQALKPHHDLKVSSVSRRLQFKVENMYLLEKNIENYFKTGFTQISLALAAQNLMDCQPPDHVYPRRSIIPVQKRK